MTARAAAVYQRDGQKMWWEMGATVRSSSEIYIMKETCRLKSWWKSILFQHDGQKRIREKRGGWFPDFLSLSPLSIRIEPGIIKNQSIAPPLPPPFQWRVFQTGTKRIKIERILFSPLSSSFYFLFFRLPSFLYFPGVYKQGYILVTDGLPYWEGWAAGPGPTVKEADRPKSLVMKAGHRAG